MMQAFLVSGLVAGFFLVYQHWTHVVSYLPWLLVLLCPLMHLFMHRGHGHQAADRSTADEASHLAHGSDVASPRPTPGDDGST